MKTLITKQVILSVILIAGIIAAKPIGDTVQSRLKTQNGNVQISGTSTLHEWTEKSDKGISEATFTITNNKLTNVSGLTFTVLAQSLKSEHTAMDNNTYKALKTDKNPNITFVADATTVSPVDAVTYTIKATGKLTIAGNTKVTDVVATGKLNADKSITVTGNKKFKMTEYGIKPPSVMLGTIKTGDDVTITYNLKFVK